MKIPTKILLLGSGELGKEFVISAKRLGCHVIACDSYAGAPAQQVADAQETFDMLDATALKKIVSRYSPTLIVPEIEAIRTELLVELEAEGTQIVPSARAVNHTMNRDSIRDLVATNLGVRTARFGYAESPQACVEVSARIGYPVVMKPVMSSSGKGQTVLTTPMEINSAWEYACSGMRGDRLRVIIEEFIKFDYEITLLTIRQTHGETLFCQPIGHRQERGDYQESWQPAPMSPHLLKQAQQIARDITTNLGGAGVFGVEMFVRNDEIIFSEVSPRPHDTGMVTLISQNLSEFDLHIRAILGLPIPDIELYGPAASSVILADQHSERVCYEGVAEAMRIPGVDVRIFGKLSSRPYRRMGVCLARGNTVDQARCKASQASKNIRILYKD